MPEVCLWTDCGSLGISAFCCCKVLVVRLCAEVFKKLIISLQRNVTKACRSGKFCVDECSEVTLHSVMRGTGSVMKAEGRQGCAAT
jgi:hypothetical protein